MRHLVEKNIDGKERVPFVVDDWQPHSPTLWQILFNKDIGLAPMMKRCIGGAWIYRRMSPLEERLYKISP